MTIPNLAIHMNREVNKGVELNRQTDMLPVFALLPEEEKKSGLFPYVSSRRAVCGKD